MRKFFFLLVVSFSCNPEHVTLEAPPALADGWETATPEQVAIDESGIAEAVSRIRASAYTDIHSMLIIRHGKLVFEAYFNGFSRTDFHVLFSATKSYSSTMLGIAIDKGYISSTNLLLKDLFPSKSSFFTTGKEEIKLVHVLTMTSGLTWDEWSTSGIGPENSHEQMMLAPSQIDYVLALPLDSPPGTKFAYSTGNSNLMAPIVEFATGTSVEQFAKDHLFGPLSITQFRWKTVIDEYPSTGRSRGGLEMTPRDMAKLGQLFLDKGKWHGEQLVSAAWVQTATEPQVRVSTEVLSMVEPHLLQERWKGTTGI